MKTTRVIPVLLLALPLLAAAPYPASPVPPADPKGAAVAQVHPKALERATAGWQLFAAHAKAHPAAEALVPGTPKRYLIEHAMHGEITGGSATRWVFMEGDPPPGPGLKVCAPLKGAGLEAGRAVEGQPLAVASVVGNAETPRAAEWVCRFEVELRPRSLGPREKDQPAVAELKQEEAKRFLAATPACDWASAAFQARLDQAQWRPRDTESETAFARRVARRLLVDHVWRNDPFTPVRLSAVPDRGPLCCWEASLTMVGALRAAGVPARVCAGYFVRTPRGYTDPAQENAHVRVEFFARGIGWVPADPTPPLKAQTEGSVGFLLPRRVGMDDGTFVVMHHDLNPIWESGKTRESFRMLPGVYVEGEGELGTLTFRQTWRAREVK